MSHMHQNGKKHDFERTHPGCLGGMVNLFELNLGVSANRLLADKPHRDGSPLSRSRSDVSGMNPSSDQIEDKVIVSEFKNTASKKKPNSTPMKMLIAQEMSKEVDSRSSSPNLVAKLMGLDALPHEEPDSAMQRKPCRGHPRSYSDIPLSYWEQQNEFLNYVEPYEYRDIYEVWEKPPHKGGYGGTNDKRMALVRQKFVEAKRLSMDEKLRQSKQFQDALEVLNSNKDLFIKCLQEPNSMFSQQLNNMQTVPPLPGTKKITVLRPSKMTDSCNYNGVGKQMKRSGSVQVNGLEKNHIGSSPPSTWEDYEYPAQPMRIVVLKPNPGITHNVKAVGSPQSESPRTLHGVNFFVNFKDVENQESREVAKAITQQMREKLGSQHKDETVISSAFSNGYVGDESSFNRSEVDYVACNLSDSELMSPVSRQSWDCVNRIGSPYSSSFSRASYSPESSVCREAKKRLSERWAMMASKGSCQEQRPTGRSSSTLGEMLALSEAKKATKLGEEPKDLNPLLASGQKTDEYKDNSPEKLLRSKSVPVSSIEFGSTLNLEVSVSDKVKAEAPKEDTNAKNAKSSFKGKISSLFFSRKKKPSKDKCPASETKDEFDSLRKIDSNKAEIPGGFNHLSLGMLESSNKPSFSNLICKQGTTFHESEFSPLQNIASRNHGENQDQPSPISVLEPTFQEDEPKLGPPFVKRDQLGVELPLNPVRSNLIDKSPPIGSVARTLSWNDSCINTASSYPTEASLTTQGTEEQKQEWFFFVETLLSVVGLQGEVQCNSFLARWHSPESPLNPSLRDSYIEFKDKEPTHEAKRRQKRSIQKLVFDCVNLALSEIRGYGPDLGQRPIPRAGTTMLDEVWAHMDAWFSGEARCVSDDFGDDNCLVVEGLVRKEVVGKAWIDQLRLETGNLGKEIEAELLEELVWETVVELTGRV